MPIPTLEQFKAAQKILDEAESKMAQLFIDGKPQYYLPLDMVDDKVYEVGPAPHHKLRLVDKSRIKWVLPK